MVLYIDFEWETEPLKMALSKNFTLPEKCKNHSRALRESLILIRQFYSKLFGSSLNTQRNWRSTIVIGIRSKAMRQFLQWTFKFTLNEENEKEKRQNAIKNNIKNHWMKTLCHRLFTFHKMISLSSYECSFIVYIFFTLILIPLPPFLKPFPNQMRSHATQKSKKQNKNIIQYINKTNFCK